MLSYLKAGNNNLDRIICRHVLCCNFSYLLWWQVAKCFANDLGQISWERFCDTRCGFKQKGNARQLLLSQCDISLVLTRFQLLLGEQQGNQTLESTQREKKKRSTAGVSGTDRELMAAAADVWRFICAYKSTPPRTVSAERKYWAETADWSWVIHGSWMRL